MAGNIAEWTDLDKLCRLLLRELELRAGRVELSDFVLRFRVLWVWLALVMVFVLAVVVAVVVYFLRW